MPGIDLKVIEHSLQLDQITKPVREKKRKFLEEDVQTIRQETEKLLAARFIEEVKYPKWLASVLMVKKSREKWRIRVDFTNLNNACPKDSFPLISIDRLVDASTSHKFVSFIDAFSSYNQIVMAKRDMEKRTFMLEDDIHCYKCCSGFG
ncbi:hypothetical protein HRI_003139700 [Hibiscus trionum]|uniref:Reverse transcriptase domain-containing protein n=1 Tax=Hibiscus trionum TaxID=183268 RepID=A0A9W7IER3_HIBTR|nr:hypothetical protein HRI_003139700 [Hibiscus trionum]